MLRGLTLNGLSAVLQEVRPVLYISMRVHCLHHSQMKDKQTYDFTDRYVSRDFLLPFEVHYNFVSDGGQLQTQLSAMKKEKALSSEIFNVGGLVPTAPPPHLEQQPRLPVSGGASDRCVIV